MRQIYNDSSKKGQGEQERTGKARGSEGNSEERSGQKGEIFDSSKYNAMNEVTEGAQLEAEKADDLAYARMMKGQEQIETTGPDTRRINPMMVEERARTIRAANEEVAAKSSARKENFVLYLNIMLSIENAAIERLHARIQQCLLPQVKEQLIHHLQETHEQKNRLVALIHELGGNPTDERAQLAGYSPPTPLANALEASAAKEEKEIVTMDIDALIEQQEVLGYNTIVQMATKMNIGEAVPAMRQSLKEEEEMVAWTRANFASSFAQLWSTMEQEHR